MRFLFLDKEMPKKLYYDEEQRKTAIKEHKKKCDHKYYISQMKIQDFLKPL